MHFALPTAVLQKLLEQRQNEASKRDAVTEQEDAFLLDPGLGAAVYLTRDGRVLVDGRDWDGTSLREATEDEAIAGLVVGAKKMRVVELLDLLPARPAGAAPCPQCGGSRWFEVGLDAATGQPFAIVCPPCSGRGWSPSSW